MADKKKLEKSMRVVTRTLAEVLLGTSSYREEADRLRRLGLETGPELEDQLASLKSRLERLEQDSTALDEEVRTLTPELFGGLVEALIHQKNAGTLIRLRDRRPGREEQKAVGAALHRLETQGVAVPKPPAAPVEVARGEPPEIYLSVLDGAGVAMLSIFWPGVTEDGCVIVKLSELEGMAAVSPARMTARAMRREMKLDDDRRGHALFQIDIGHALFLLDEAITRTREQHRFIPLELTRLVQQLEDYGQTRGKQALPEGAGSIKPLTGSLEAAGALLAVPSISMWQIDPEYLQPILMKIIELMQSQVVVSEAVRQERFESVLREAAVEFFTPERRHRAARRLEEIALWMDGTPMKPLGELAYGSALALREASIPASEIPFAYGLLSMNIQRFLRQAFPAGPGGMGDEEGHQLETPTARPADDKPLIILP